MRGKKVLEEEGQLEDLDKTFLQILEALTM